MKVFAWLKDTGGFTLIELMTVVVIIGILAVIAMPQFSKQADRARLGRAKAEIKSVQKILEIYFSEHKKYPAAAATNGTVNGIKDVLAENGISWTDDSTGTYKDPWGNGYLYVAKTGEEDTGYEIYCTGPDGWGSGNTQLKATHTQEPTEIHMDSQPPAGSGKAGFLSYKAP
ncbi:MAG TPA: type II secretion system protein GspG [Bacillota bacterium]|nr:type II secretion system protein GspG [Bacillota bacterium]